jgi:GNAT superfamily N-acetyltransferase
MRPRALAALDAGPDSRIVGVARALRLEASDAEPAIAVVDDHQGRGVGTALIAALVERSRSQGVTRYRAHVLADNVLIPRLLDAVGTALD